MLEAPGQSRVLESQNKESSGERLSNSQKTDESAMKLSAHALESVAAMPVLWEAHIAVRLVLTQGKSQAMAATRDSSEEDALRATNWPL